MSARGRHSLLAGLSLVIAVAAVLAWILSRAAADPPPPPADTAASIGGPLPAAAPVPPGFVGLSIEYQGLGTYVAGPGPDAPLEGLIRALAPGNAPILRIGGDSTDHSWWPAAGVTPSPGLKYAITPQWLAGVHRLVADTGARVILGINLEADNVRLARIEARQLVAGIGRSSIRSLEIGNEPNLYGVLPWYVTATKQWVRGRPASYDPAALTRDLTRFARSLPRLPLALPALGDAVWMSSLQEYLRAVPRTRDVTYHRYPMNRCFTHPGEPTYPTIAHLLSPLASRGLAATIAPYVAVAHRHHADFRVDELNSVACEGKQGVSDVYASALWMLDTLFAMEREGAAGVNIHTFPGGRYRLFTLHGTGAQRTVTVAPEYYGVLMFERAAPAGSRLLRVALRGPATVRAWATRSGTPQTTRVLLINVDSRRRHVVQVTLPGTGGPATLQRLRAPRLTSRTGITLDGTTFARDSATGQLTGAALRLTAPRIGTGYRVVLPPFSATLLTVPGT